MPWKASSVMEERLRSDVDPLPYQSEDASIANPPLNHLHEMSSSRTHEVGSRQMARPTSSSACCAPRPGRNP